MKTVTHKQIYYQLMGGTTNTTLCGRVDNNLKDGYNVSAGDDVTCKFCLKILSDPKHWAHRKMIKYGIKQEAL